MRKQGLPTPNTHQDTLNRRGFLTTIGSVGVGVVGISASTGTAEATDYTISVGDSWQAYNKDDGVGGASDSTFHIGSVLKYSGYQSVVGGHDHYFTITGAASKRPMNGGPSIAHHGVRTQYNSKKYPDGRITSVSTSVGATHYNKLANSHEQDNQPTNSKDAKKIIQTLGTTAIGLVKEKIGYAINAAQVLNAIFHFWEDDHSALTHMWAPNNPLKGSIKDVYHQTQFRVNVPNKGTGIVFKIDSSADAAGNQWQVAVYRDQVEYVDHVF